MLGAGQDRVRENYGPPRETYPLPGGGVRWLYPTKPAGQFTYAAEFDAAGKLTAFRQVLDTQLFQRAAEEKWAQQQVLELFVKRLEILADPAFEFRFWRMR